MFSFESVTSPTKLNIALWGPSGAGKTYTGLAIAHQLGSHVAVLDTEHRASSLYTARFPAHIASLEPPFGPERYIEAIQAAETAGYDVLVVDSLSPEWDGPGGCLALVADARKRGVKSHHAWNDVTPRHEALLGAINRTRLSIVVTLREKPRVIVGTGDNGKTNVQEGAPTPVTRERFEYEYDLVLHLDGQHRATVMNSRFLSMPEGAHFPADGSLLDRVRMGLKVDGNRSVEVTG